ncbi:hypothetical protein XHV734_0635 [Xanthomonas hortorum pv. vitians]|nr:hypothetical protein XHV734_0635 [Xanthomonas hortorum pv. vitians]
MRQQEHQRLQQLAELKGKTPGRMAGRYVACIDWTSTDQLRDLIPKSLLELAGVLARTRPRLKYGRRCAHDAVFG